MRRRWLCLFALLALARGVPAAEGPAKGGEESFGALEKQVFELVNQARAEQHIPPLAWHAGAAAVARAHSLDMKVNGFFSHESKRTGKVADRLARAGVPNRVAGENLARADSVANCHKALMASPGHRENILRRDFTHVGVGLARNAEGLLLCTQVFLQEVPVVDVAAARTQIIEGINKERLARGLRRLLEDDVLMQQALAHSERAAKAGRPDPAWLDGELRRKDSRWRLHEASYFLTDTTSNVILSPLALSLSHDHLGVGVVQSPLNGKEAGALWVTLLCAQKK